MLNNIHFTSEELSNNQATIIFVNEQLELDNTTLLLDQKYHGIISKTIQNKLVFNDKTGQINIASYICKDGELKYFIIVCIGNEETLESFFIEELGGKIYTQASCHKIKTIGTKITNSIGRYKSYEFATLISNGFLLASYKFDKYKTKQSEAEKCAIHSLEVSTNHKDEAIALFENKKSLAEAIFFARDISNEPANIKTPTSYSERVAEYLEPLGVDVTIIGEREMKNLGMGALLGVGQGSQNESKLVIMEYQGLDDSTPPIAFVGKGVTFDTGGISLKPAGNMEEMKYDMCGSAAVVATIMALAKRNAMVNAVGIIGLVENMPSGNAQRPGDIVTTMSGQTVEVLNTDAEGRLVLADALWYTQEKFHPKCIIDLATLTGAIVVSLGKTYAGCFTNDDQLAKQLIESGNKVNEKLWRMPMHKEYDEMIKSNIADMANISTSPQGGAGSSTAAQFINRFIQKDVVWAHLDIAGVAYSKMPSALAPKGAIGYGVRLLDQFVKDHYEK
jgi:leucyl aminopeptidase